MIKKPIALLILFLSIQSFAQRNSISPYSFFGIGEETAQKTVEEISMGQIGTAFSSPYRLSFSNPAALGSLQLTTYTLAGVNKALSIDDGINSESSSAASLSYMALGIPLGTKGGFSFGLQPNTTVGYSLLQSFKDSEDNLIAINQFKGKGGTNRVFLGFGYRIIKNLNLGIETSYIFGSSENTLLNRRNGVILATMHKTNSTATGVAAKVGMIYDSKISDKLTLKIGGVVNLKNNLTNEGEEYLFSLISTNDDVVSPRDTLISNSFKNDIKNPLRTTLSTGIGQENKWYAGIEYSFKDPLDFTDAVLDQNSVVSYSKSSRVSVGGFYLPKFNSITNYWSRITYRAGFNYKKTGLMVNNTEVKDFGMSFGVGLPMGKQLSNINIGFELGKRGELKNQLIKEKYLNFRLSLTLNDKWFNKRKLN